MGQATKSAHIPAFAPRWATPGNGIIGTVVLTLLVIVSVVAVGAFSRTPATVGNGAIP